jgi:MerR family transcriptional regulator/heat shock protein HspR
MRQTQGIYLISVVAKTLEMHPQTLRKYERAGFIEPLRMGSLRTYSDEDIARLRLIKHFVDDMGLNLAGVNLALQLTNELLEVRMRLSSDETPSGPVAASVRQIDGMLATLGVRVVARPEPEGNLPPAQPGEGWFKVNPGETVEFDAPPSRQFHH